MLQQLLRYLQLVSTREREEFFHWCDGRNISPCKAFIYQIDQLFLFGHKEVRLMVPYD